MINLNGTLYTTTVGNDNNILFDIAIGSGTLTGMDGADLWAVSCAGDDSLAGGNDSDVLYTGMICCLAAMMVQ